MRLYAPLYEGDSVLRPDAAIGASERRIFKAPAATPGFVQSNIQAKAAELTALDLHAIEQAARVLRNAEVARLFNIATSAVANAMKAAHTAIADWLESIDTRERDHFFAQSSNLADLEQRQRHWERTGSAHY